MHRHRVLSALLLIPAFLLLVRQGTPLHFHLLVALAAGLAAWEFGRLCPAGSDAWLPPATAAAAVAWQGALVAGSGLAGVGAALGAAAVAWGAGSRAGFRTGILRGAWLALGALYAGGCLGLAGLLRGLPDGEQYIYFLALTTWAADSAAFYAGRRLGRRPLAPSISPKKSVEGAVVGILATVLVAGLGSLWIWPRIPWTAAAPAGGLLAVVGIGGDLCESAVKRAAEVKDSGGIIPGHGGILDRLDSLMFAGPALYGLVWLGWM